MLRRRQNYTSILLDENACNKDVGCMRRDGSFQYVRWLGFISVEGAKALPQARPVRLEIEAISSVDPSQHEWKRLAKNEYVQGCLIEGGMFGVVVGGTPASSADQTDRDRKKTCNAVWSHLMAWDR